MNPDNDIRICATAINNLANNPMIQANAALSNSVVVASKSLMSILNFYKNEIQRLENGTKQDQCELPDATASNLS